MFSAILLAASMVGQVASPDEVKEFATLPHVTVEVRGDFEADIPATMKQLAKVKQHLTHVRTDAVNGLVICKWRAKPNAKSVGAVLAAFDRVVPFDGPKVRQPVATSRSLK